VFDVAQIADGPLAKVRLRSHPPFSFHGGWEAAWPAERGCPAIETGHVRSPHIFGPPKLLCIERSTT
jgi:hypothetical protein